jgi:hypothetical protein
VAENGTGRKRARTSAAIAISKIEMVFIAASTLAGLGIWLAAAWHIDSVLPLVPLSGSAVRVDRDVFLHEARLAHTRGKLEAYRAAIDTLAREDDALSAAATLLRDAYPLLPAPIADTGVITIPVEAVRDYFAARKRLSAAREASARDEREIAALDAEIRKVSVTLRLQQADAPEFGAALTRQKTLEATLARAQQRYAEQWVMAAEQYAEVESVLDDYPPLGTLTNDTKLPPDVMLRHLETGIRQREVKAILSRLQRQTATLEQAVKAQAQALTAVETAVTRELTRGKLGLAWLRGLVLLAAAWLIFWVGGFCLQRQLARYEPPDKLNSDFVRQAVTGLLAVLFAYHLSTALALLLLGGGLLRVLFRDVMVANSGRSATTLPPDTQPVQQGTDAQESHHA